jgi:hypothetical protein
MSLLYFHGVVDEREKYIQMSYCLGIIALYLYYSMSFYEIDNRVGAFTILA